jgi:hypothetical protein
VGALSYNLAEGIVALARDIPLSKVDFSEVSITADGDAGGQGVAKSGVRVYTRLPFFEGTDLELVCPGTSSVVIGDSPRLQSIQEGVEEVSNKLPTWSIVLMSVLGAVFLVAFVFVSLLVSREKSGRPYFMPAVNENKATMG